MTQVINPIPPGGTGHLGLQAVARIGFGGHQLVREITRDAALMVLRRAVELGVNHIDTASYYNGGEVNRRIRTALAPRGSSYPDGLVIVSKVGASYTGGHPIPVIPAQKPAELRAAVETDLRQLGLETVPVVNLRRYELGPATAPTGDQNVDLDDQLAEMIALRDEGKIGAIGISSVPLDVLRRAVPAGIVCVQNAYSLLDRAQQDALDYCAQEGIAWVPYFPLGSAFPRIPKVTDNPTVREIAHELHVTPAQIGLAWLLTTSANTLLIPGTGSLAHLQDNVAAGDIVLSDDARGRLDAVTARGDGPDYASLRR